MAKHARKCTNCRTGATSCWRTGPNGRQLCNKCGIYWKKHRVQRPPTAKLVRTVVARARRRVARSVVARARRRVARVHAPGMDLLVRCIEALEAAGRRDARAKRLRRFTAARTARTAATMDDDNAVAERLHAALDDRPN